MDALDRGQQWQPATVVDIGKNVGVAPQVKVGHRVYTDAGDKVDGEGRRYSGYSPNLDEWIGSHTVRLQRFGAMTAGAEEVGDGVERAHKVRPLPGAAGAGSPALGDAASRQDARDMAMIEEEG